MPLYSDEELKQLPEFEDLGKALRKPEKVFRFQAYRHEDAESLARVAELRNLQSLSISLSNVTKLLPLLSELSDLQVVYLQACNIQTFPESILGLRHLRSLSIGNNSLSCLPNEIGCLEALESLNFAQNELSRIPDSLGKLIRLKTLGLSYNRIEELPESIGNLDALERLLLGVNSLKRVPEVIGNLQYLQSLMLDFNKLSALPDVVCQLARLKSLGLEHNPLESLPFGLSLMAGLDISIEAEKRALFMDWSYKHSAKPPQAELSELSLFVSPSSRLFLPLKTTVQENGLAEVESIILGVAREAVRIETTVPDDGSQLGVSRLGGFPDLEDPALFPKTHDLHWIFLAQLNLAELAPFNNYLPRSGLLSFFVDTTENLNSKVIFYQGETENLTVVRHEGADDMLSPDDDYTQKPHRVRFERFFSLPHRCPSGIESDQAFEAYESCEVLHKGVDHQINGYTFTQHESPQEQAAKELRGQPAEWVPLLQLGWDANVGFCFWDAGTLTFCIHQEDLRRCDFSNVHVSLESS